GIVLISYFNQLKKEGKMSIKEIVVTGGLARLRPVIMTAAVASMGFLPMALSTTAGAEVQKPLATVVIGGLISSTLLTLLLLPIIYNLVERKVKISKAVIIALPLLIASIIPGRVDAQSLTLEAAIDSALSKNQIISNAELAILQAKSRKNGSLKLGATGVNVGYGQMNSEINDTYLEINQQFGNLFQQAKATSANKILVERETESAVLLKRMLVRDVKMSWQDLLYRKSVVDRYSSQIDIIKNYRQKAEKKQELGEMSKSEIGLIIMEQSDMYRQLALAEIDYSDAVKSFKQLTKIKSIGSVLDSLTLLPFESNAIDQNYDALLLSPYLTNTSYLAEKIKEA
ncbi:MAG: efflux RND transporter permease subunit, partial [Thiotrichaceae bacterium]|nr:efflux RND transporter permease subunit [Thiotrichaceae bacterium]